MSYILIFFICFVGSVLSQGDPYARESDPVVLKGSVLPNLLAQDPGRILAFSWTGSAFEQVPVQVDEMHDVLWSTLKDGDCYILGRNLTQLVYADPGTYSGADEDATFDEDDEVAFMARHLGLRYDGSDLASDLPPGVQADPFEELDIWDPLTGSSVGFMYLFTGDLDQGAGQQLVTYDFQLTKTGPGKTNDYFDAYETQCKRDNVVYECHDPYPKNPEDSVFRSAFYERHFSFNWFSDVLKIFVGDSTGEDILSIQDFQFLLEGCVRYSKTFTDGRTAFIANKAGAVRAIRSWVGANSGAITQREHIMYEQRDDQNTFLRVHPIPGVMDYVVHEAGIPLTYYNCNHEEGIPVDGIIDSDKEVENTMCHWEFVTGDAGTFVRTIDLIHDLHFHPEYDPDVWFNHWYYDNAVPDDIDGGNDGSPIYYLEPQRWNMCGAVVSGQVEAWGTHGVKFDFQEDLLVANTDPMRGDCCNDPSFYPPDACIDGLGPYPQVFQFEYYVKHYYDEPNMHVDRGQQYYEAAFNDLYRYGF